MKELSFERMEDVHGGASNWGCAASLGLAVTIWSVAVGAFFTPLAGGVVGYAGSLAVTYVCG